MELAHAFPEKLVAQQGVPVSTDGAGACEGLCVCEEGDDVEGEFCGEVAQKVALDARGDDVGDVHEGLDGAVCEQLGEEGVFGGGGEGLELQSDVAQEGELGAVGTPGFGGAWPRRRRGCWWGGEGDERCGVGGRVVDVSRARDAAC